MSDRLGHIRTMLDMITPGEWRAEISTYPTGERYSSGDIMSGDEHVVCFGHDYDEYGYIRRVEDAEFIAAAPSNVRFLLAELDAARSAQTRLEEALRITRAYDEHAWGCVIDGCKRCHALQRRMVDARCEALGDEVNPPGFDPLAAPSSTPGSAEP